MCSSELSDTGSCLGSTSEDSGSTVAGGSFKALPAPSAGAVIRTIIGGCGKATGSVTGAGGEGSVAWGGGGGGGGGDDGGESPVVDSAMTAGNGTVAGGAVTGVAVASSGLDVT